MANLRVGIAGFGIVGKRRKNVLQKQDGVEVVAVCDSDPKQLLNPESGITFYNDYKSLFEENLDILFVCLTNNIAATVTKDALRRGLHVFCEKPPGMNMDDRCSFCFAKVSVFEVADGGTWGGCKKCNRWFEFTPAALKPAPIKPVPSASSLDPLESLYQGDEYRPAEDVAKLKATWKQSKARAAQKESSPDTRSPC